MAERVPATKLISDTMMKLVEHRGRGKTICPSEVARALSSEDWRAIMPQVHDVASGLAESGALRIYRKGEPIMPDQRSGPYRLGLGGEH